MARSIRDYVSEGAYVSYEQLITRFGNPKQVAFTYVIEMETGELIKEFSNKKKYFILALITAVTLVALWIGYLGHCFLRLENSTNGYAVVEIIEIERRSIDEGGH